MQITTHPVRPVHRPSFLFWLIAGATLVFILIAQQHLTQQSTDHRLRMEKSSGRNGKHANQKAKDKAENAYQKAKESYDKIRSKPGKTAEEKLAEKNLKKQLKHLQKKKDWSGENHSQKHKGH